MLVSCLLLIKFLPSLSASQICGDGGGVHAHIQFDMSFLISPGMTGFTQREGDLRPAWIFLVDLHSSCGKGNLLAEVPPVAANRIWSRAICMVHGKTDHGVSVDPAFVFAQELFGADQPCLAGDVIPLVEILEQHESVAPILGWV